MPPLAAFDLDPYLGRRGAVDPHRQRRRGADVVCRVSRTQHKGARSFHRHAGVQRNCATSVAVAARILVAIGGPGPSRAWLHRCTRLVVLAELLLGCVFAVRQHNRLDRADPDVVGCGGGELVGTVHPFAGLEVAVRADSDAGRLGVADDGDEAGGSLVVEGAARAALPAGGGTLHLLDDPRRTCDRPPLGGRVACGVQVALLARIRVVGDLRLMVLRDAARLVVPWGQLLHRPDVASSPVVREQLVRISAIGAPVLAPPTELAE
jgi:hypothetical protein